MRFDRYCLTHKVVKIERYGLLYNPANHPFYYLYLSINVEKETKIPDRNKSPWKWGMFYYDPDDKRIFPPRGNTDDLGWTVNFANPYGVAFVIFLLFIGPVVQSAIVYPMSRFLCFILPPYIILIILPFIVLKGKKPH